MKSSLFILLFFCTSLGLKAQDEYVVTGDFSGLSFKEVVAKVESQLPVRFFYKEEWVKDLYVSDNAGCESLRCLLDNLLSGKSLYYYIDRSGNVVITANYAVKVSSAPLSGEEKFMAPTEYGETERNQAGSGNTYIEVGNPAEKNMSGNVTLSGYVTNKDTRDPVAGVTVFVQKLSSGTVSNQFGYYSLSLPRGAHQVQFSFVGMKNKVVNLNLYGEGELNVDMTSVLIPLKETVVSAQRSMTLKRYEVGAEKINITSFKLLPTSMGESDIIKNIMLIAGVQSVGEGSAGFNVRGGSADQNLILLYDAPVYNSSHFFGFFSAVNSDIIKDATLYKGGIPSRYGGRISSVLDIGTRDGNRQRLGGSAGISPITTHFLVEGPIKKDTLTFILSGRTTYSNWILGLIQDPSLKNSKASFYDLNGTINYDINRKNKLELSSYVSHDAFSFNSDTVYSYNNRIFALKWRHFFNSRFLSSISLNNSSYDYNISSQRVASEAFDLSHKISSTGLKSDFNLFLGRNELNFGVDMNSYSVLPGSYQPANDSSMVVPDMIERERAVEGAVYIDDKFILNDFLSINLGMRYSSYFSFGKQTVMIYNPEFTKSFSSIVDTVQYGTGKIVSKYGGPELRASLNFSLSERNSLKINYNRTRQYVHLLSNSTSISPTDTWKLCDYYLKPEIGDQYALGFYRLMFNKSYEFSAETYYKTIKNIVDFKAGTDLVMDKNIEKDVVDMKGKAYGLELVMKKNAGKIRYSIGYTYSRIFIKSLGVFSDEIINGQKWFPANYDKPNDLVVTFNYLFSRRVSLSANYTYSTGRPITYPVATYYIGNKLLVDYSNRNKYRIPDYSRLDVSLKIGGNLRSHKIAHPNWTFSVYNLLGRENIYSIYFKQEGNHILGYKLSVFGRAIPSVTFSFDF
jgi:hypothetical protein